MKPPLLLIALAVGLFQWQCQPPEAQKPLQNVVFILVDDLGARDLSCYGSAFHQTPNLDRLAAQGLRFTQAYSANPVCSPTRAALMTGKHPNRLNITDWIPGQDPQDRPWLGPQDATELALEEVTLAEALREWGYTTFFAGKWHLGDEGYFPEDQGFQENHGGHHRGSPPGGYYSPYKNPKLSDGPEGEYLPDRLTDEAIAFLQRSGTKPFLLYLSYYTVHTPIQASKKHFSEWEAAAEAQFADTKTPTQAEGRGQTRLRQDRADYASMVAAMDENVGRLLDQLDSLNLADNTLVVFTSDNGGLSTLFPKRNAPTSNYPLRAGKGWCYEGGIRVPLIIRAGTAQKQGLQSAEPVVSQDLFPTILTELDLPPRAELDLDGTSLSPLLSGADSLPSRPLFWHFPHYHGSAWEPGSALRWGEWKYIRFYTPEREELYHLATDPGEQNDLADADPAQLALLREMLTEQLKETGAKFPRENPNFP
jgi:arylsulfatase A-like enzyme